MLMWLSQSLSILYMLGSYSSLYMLANYSSMAVTFSLDCGEIDMAVYSKKYVHIPTLYVWLTLAQLTLYPLGDVVMILKV